MNLIVVGCGRVGSELAYRLFRQGHQVTVVDSVAAAFDNLPAEFRGRTVEGEVLNQDVLRRAGIEHTDGLAAVANDDALNAVVGHLAHAVYHLDNVVVRNYDPRRRPLLEAFGLQIVSSASWGAQRMEELLYQREIRTVFSAGNGEVEVYELAVPPAWSGRPLGKLLPDSGCVAVALTRAGRAMLPTPEEPLLECDVLHVSGTLEGITALRARLNQGGMAAALQTGKEG